MALLLPGPRVLDVFDHGLVDGAPEDGYVGDDAADGEALEGVGGGELGDEVAEVEDGAEPGVVLPDEVGVGFEAEVGGEVEGVLGGGQ